jgi:beta-glucanase (GH16 family)
MKNKPLIIVILLLRVSGCTDTTADPVPSSQPTKPGGFVDYFDGESSALFQKADGWTNGYPFYNGWRADHITFSNGILQLTLDKSDCPVNCSGQPYVSGEYRTRHFYGYGRVEARIKPARQSGVMGGSLFTYTGAADGYPHDEIDIEFVGEKTTHMQTNYFTNGIGGHETMVDLGFDAAADYHRYAFDWSPEAIRWYVDERLVHTETGLRGPLPTHPGKIMMNLWPGTGIDSWLGPFSYSGAVSASYDWIRYTPSEILLKDGFETDQGWTFFEEIVGGNRACYGSGIGSLSRSTEFAQTGLYSLKVASNQARSTQSNHFFGRIKLYDMDQGLTGRYRYRFFTYIPVDAQDGQTGPEFSVQNTRTVSGKNLTHIAGIQYVGNPYVHKGTGWNIWHNGIWVPLFNQRLSKGVWYKIELMFDFIDNRYQQLTIMGNDLSLSLDLTQSQAEAPGGFLIKGEDRGFGPGVQVTLEAENLYTCDRPAITYYPVFYDQVELIAHN